MSLGDTYFLQEIPVCTSFGTQLSIESLKYGVIVSVKVY